MIERMGGQPESAQGAQPEGWMDSLKSWFGINAAQPEGGGTSKADPTKDPTSNPDTESEHVKGAKYEKVEGSAFIKGAGDANDIDPNDVSQGQLGDCYFVAALAAIAKNSPDTLRRMITDNKNGTYNVRFHEGGDVVVDNQFAKKDGAVQFAAEGDTDAKQGTELWVMLIEKAWAKLKGGYEVVRGSKVKMSSTEAISNAMTQGWPATIGVKNITEKAAADECKKTGLVPNHAFAIMGVNTNSKTIQVYNPWGKEYKVPDITMATLKKYVDTVHINKD